MRKKFYENKKDAVEYVESCEGKDGRLLIDILKTHLKPNSTVLELGMGGGKDLEILNETYQAIGSDFSQTFLNIYKEKNPVAELLLIDAISMKTDLSFDCIYSNKVLHHLSTENLTNSLTLQNNRLNNNGIMFHTFWLGKNRNQYQDIEFNQFSFAKLQDIAKKFEILEMQTYSEMNLNDSAYIILRGY